MRLSDFDVVPPAATSRAGEPALDETSSHSIAKRAAFRPRDRLLPRQARALAAHAHLAGIGGRAGRQGRGLAARADLAGLGGRAGRQAPAPTPRAARLP